MKRKIVYLTLAVVVIVLLAVVLILTFSNKDPHSTSAYRNGLRIEKVRMLSTSLDLYYDDNKKYPMRVDELTSGTKYTGEVPVFTDAYRNQGYCPEKYLKDYEYVPLGPDYKIIFCLHENDSQYKAGIHIMTPRGIDK